MQEDSESAPLVENDEFSAAVQETGAEGYVWCIGEVHHMGISLAVASPSVHHFKCTKQTDTSDQPCI